MFSVKVLRDERIVVIAEQRPDCAEEEVSISLSVVHSVFQSVSAAVVATVAEFHVTVDEQCSCFFRTILIFPLNLSVNLNLTDVCSSERLTCSVLAAAAAAAAAAVFLTYECTAKKTAILIRTLCFLSDL